MERELKRKEGDWNRREWERGGEGKGERKGGREKR